ncbi:MAG: DUF3378 domain-containing protein [Candidatus Diapherotrites archaeon]
MQQVLNFSSGEKGKMKKILEEFPQIGTNTQYEEYRCKIGACTVTLYSTGRVVIQGETSELVKGMVLGKMDLKEELVFGIDETGRGESTGPFVVTGVLGDRNKLRGLRDSKKMSDIQSAYKLATANSMARITVSLNSGQIDRVRNKGLTMNEIEAKIVDSMAKLMGELGENAQIRVDGSALNTKEKGIEFLVKGDDKDSVIGAASVIAKAVRDMSGDTGTRKSWKTKK